MRRAARHLTQAYDKYLSQAGLRISQYSLLRALARMGPMNMQAAAREMGLDRTTLGRNLRPLERDGLVSIEIDDADRRGRSLDLTEAGRAKLALALPLWQAAQSSFEAAYGTDRTSGLNTTLEEIAGRKTVTRRV